MKKTRFTQLKHSLFILSTYFLSKQNVRINLLSDFENNDELLLENRLLKLLDCKIKPNNYDTNILKDLGLNENCRLLNVFYDKKSKPNLPKIFEILEKLFDFKGRINKEVLN